MIKIHKNMLRSMAFIAIAILIIPAGILAQHRDSAPFSEEELAQMLAPIALYPDSLITQILMASTYPLDVVEAERWLRRNPEIRGEALNNALLDKPWDPSIKSLCHFPDVLVAMSEDLELTRDLGDAFLDQEDDVMATIQVLRRKAKGQGYLHSTDEQTIVIEREIIRIEPADPEVVYVPVYDPYYVYGRWWYPDYPPHYWYYPRSIVISGGLISFGLPYYIGFDLFSWSWYDWERRHIYVDVHKAKRFHRFRDRHVAGKYSWQHDPKYRKGGMYRERRTEERFRKRPEADIGMRKHPGLNSTKRIAARSADNKIRLKRTDTLPLKTEREKIRKSAERREKINATKRASVRAEAVRKPDSSRVSLRKNTDNTFKRKPEPKEIKNQRNEEMDRTPAKARDDDRFTGNRGQGWRHQGVAFNR